MADKQRKLIFSAFRALKVGGTLVYSTCTISPEENELLIAKFLSKHPNAKLLPVSLPGVNKLEIPTNFRQKEIPIEIIKNTLRIKPSSTIEGFFVAKIQKTETLNH
jgi:16S rRNA (cytosine1407-C5)-methyltransferase